jgi:hypothetical protein
MAITPTRVDELKAAQNSPAVKECEAKIDKYLTEREPGADGAYWYGIDNLPEGVLTAVIKQYQNAGWNARVVVSNHREGNSLVLSRREERRYPDPRD